MYNDVTALSSNAFKCGLKTRNRSEYGSANPAFPSRENVVFRHTGRYRYHVKYTKNSTYLAVCYLLSSNGMFSNLHRNLQMQLFTSFQITAFHFSTPIFTDLDSLCRLQLLQTMEKFHQQDIRDCSFSVSVAKCPWPAPWIYRFPRSFEFVRPNCSASI